jgi:alkylation response protein AidB-like acyl-CoA dehydrogenase
MDLEFTTEELKFRDEVRAWIAENYTDDFKKRMELTKNGSLDEKHQKAWLKKLAEKGWLVTNWPTEHGGPGWNQTQKYIYEMEMSLSGAPRMSSMGVRMCAPVIMKFGTEEQKKKFLPAILAGEVHFAIGYSEPEAGTDLAALRTSAVRHGDEYVVNGQKIWTTGGHDADYVWLACRTDPEAPKHKGISILIVDTTDPGYSWTPIILSDGAHHTNATYYNDVRVPAGMLVGGENAGWRLITTQLNHERVMLGPAGKIAGLYDRVHAWASKPGGDGVTPIDRDDVRRALGEIRAIWRVNELLNWQVAAAGETVDIADAAATKVFSTERIQRIGRLAEEIVGKYGNPAEDETAELLEWLDAQTKRSLVITFGGGVNEVMREQVAAAGLGVPRVPR